jgi:hypothetical protein
MSVVDFVKNGKGIIYYPDYHSKTFKLFTTDDHIRSIKSLLQEHGVITVNPYSKPEQKDFYEEDGAFDHTDYAHASMAYEQAQSQLWENVLILKKDE